MDTICQQKLNKKIISNCPNIIVIDCESLDETIIVLKVGVYFRLASITEDFKGNKNYWVGKEEFRNVRQAVEWVMRFV